jgi:serine/threonine protein kinase
VIGRTLTDIYRIHELVGTGAFANVYLGRDVVTNTVVAVKVLHRHLTQDQSIVRRFWQEARTVQQLTEPHVVRVLTVGEDNGDHYIVMEYVQGHTLGHLIRTRGALPIAEAVGYVEQILLALAAAHDQGIVHRDIKPQNIMVTAGDLVKVMDFGIAKDLASESMTRTGMYLGTPKYMAPEQVRGARADARSDLYAVAVTLFELLTGQAPFQADDTERMIEQQLTVRAPLARQFRADLPAALERVVARGLEKAPDRRFQDAREMLAAIRQAVPATTGDQRQATTNELPGGPPARQVSRESRRLLLATGAAAIAGVVGLVAVVAIALSGSTPSSAGPDAPRPEVTAQTAQVVAVAAAASPSPRVDLASPVPVAIAPTPTRSPAPTTDVPSPTQPTAPAISALAPTQPPASTTVAQSPILPSPPLPSAPSPTHLPAPSPTVSRPVVAPEALTGTIIFTSISAGRQHLYSMRPGAPDSMRQLTSQDHDNQNAACSSDGRQVVFQSNRSGTFKVYRLSLDSPGDVHQLTRGNANDQIPTWSADGRGIGFTRVEPDSAALFSVSHDGQAERQLSPGRPGDWRMGYSPDGTQIVFTSTRRESNDLWLMDVDGTNVRQLTSGAADDRDPAWSPDGRWIIFLSDRGGHRWDLYRVAPEGGEPVRLSSGVAGLTHPNWSPDSQWIIFSAAIDGQPRLYRIPWNGGERTLVSGSARAAMQPAWCR